MNVSDLSQPMQAVFHDVLKKLCTIRECTQCGLSFALIASIGRAERCNGVRDHYCEADEGLVDSNSISIHRDLLPVLKQVANFDPPV